MGMKNASRERETERESERERERENLVTKIVDKEKRSLSPHDILFLSRVEIIMTCLTTCRDFRWKMTFWPIRLKIEICVKL